MSSVQQQPQSVEEEIKEIEKKVNKTLENVLIPIGDQYSFTITVNLKSVVAQMGGKSTRRRQKK